MMSSEEGIKLAENLKRIMKARNLTITSIAREVGMHKSTLHNYCNGVIPRNLLKLKELADFLGVGLSDLIFDSPVSTISIPSEDGIEGKYEITIKRVIEKTMK